MTKAVMHCMDVQHGQRTGLAVVQKSTRVHTVKQHAFVVVVVVLVCDLLLPVCVTLPQLLVHHFLDLWARDSIYFDEPVCNAHLEM